MANIAIIGVPVDLGAGRRGVDMGPSAIRLAGLKERLEELGHTVNDTGNVAVPQAEQFAPPEPGEKIRYLEPLVAMNRKLAHCVSTAVAEQQFPLILGGDHSLAIGSVVGTAQGRRIGLIWIDAHADFNTPETTPSGNVHGMSVAALSGRGHPSLTALLDKAPVLRERDIALVGIRDLDRTERAALKESGVHVFTMHDIDKRGMAAVMDEAVMRVCTGNAGFHLSFDMDALDPSAAPGVGTPVLGGITYREAHLAMELVSDSKHMLGMDLVEVNPILDQHNATAELAVQLALSALGKRIY